MFTYSKGKNIVVPYEAISFKHLGCKMCFRFTNLSSVLSLGRLGADLGRLEESGSRMEASLDRLEESLGRLEASR